jgi:hypothetical protein
VATECVYLIQPAHFFLVLMRCSLPFLDVPEREAQSWWTAFSVVDQLINTLRAELPDIAQLQGRSTARTILLTQSLLNAATIKLHSIFYTDPTSRQNCLAAARDMFRFGGTSNPQGLGYLNPMMGVSRLFRAGFLMNGN